MSVLGDLTRGILIFCGIMVSVYCFRMAWELWKKRRALTEKE